MNLSYFFHFRKLKLKFQSFKNKFINTVYIQIKNEYLPIKYSHIFVTCCYNDFLNGKENAKVEFLTLGQKVHEKTDRDSCSAACMHKLIGRLFFWIDASS